MNLEDELNTLSHVLNSKEIKCSNFLACLFQNDGYFRSMQMNKKTIAIIAIIIVAALTRLIPHPMNFAPLGAMALFGSAYLGRKGVGLLVTMLAWMASDLILNNLVYSTGGFTLFTDGAIFIYASIVLIYLLGTKLFSKVTITRMLVGSLSASLIFFIVSNFGVWAGGLMYPMSFDGLIASYAAAIPFFQNTITGDLVYSVALFIDYEKIFKAQLTAKKIESE